MRRSNLSDDERENSDTSETSELEESVDKFLRSFIGIPVTITSQKEGKKGKTSNRSKENFTNEVLQVIQVIKNSNQPKNERNRARKLIMWTRDLVKTLRQSGQEYTNRSNKLIPKKEPRICDCSKCRFQCSEIGEELRRQLCAEYYALADSQKQKLFLSSCMRNGDVRRRKESRSKNREVSRSYFLPLSGSRKRVCKKFFAATFCISERMLSNTAEQSSPISGLYVKDDGRKGKPTHNATPPDHVQFIKDFIDSFPRVPSQSCRRDAKCEYLSTVSNLNALYRLYRKKCIEIDYAKHVGRTTFSCLFHNHDPKLSFNIPQKDQCSKCNAYNKQQGVVQGSTENSDV